ncbi:hypothetical protein EDB86DRAFT_3072948 [Lactarius hatsudake]|nr:hypothetical protein EDB86DRAFT_3072948 [Lactarius hatsudake]
MAVATQHSTKAASRHVPHSHPDPAQPRASRQRFVIDFSQCLFEFVVQLLPTVEELAVKEDVRKLLERLIRTIEPDSRLLSFGSTANGFSLRNSDMDLCCLIDSEERLAATDLVTMLGDLLERETKFRVKPLPHARIPIVKLSLDPSLALPLGIACDIGFENRLALENTRLLYCYAMIDPARVRTLVLFLKVWCKRRKINSPYKGTLSSYGYVLLVIYFLVHVKNPPVLPNLQQMPPMRPISHVRTISSRLSWLFAYMHAQEDTHIGGHNTWFFDDVELLRQRWQSANTDSVGQLLIDFFKYFSRDFLYNTGVASIRAGLLKKDSKGWQNDLDPARYKDARERNRFCIEDPFETDFNVARCVTRDGLYTIRGEFMRASRILSTRPERTIYAIAQLCEERMEALIPATSPTAAFVPPRLSPFPPQTPYTVGSKPMRQTKIDVPDPKNVSEAPSTPPPPSEVSPAPHPSTSTPDHMAPKRFKWTSPPPPSASAEDRSQFEGQLDLGLALATLPTDARQMNAGYASSSNNSEILTDDGDDLQSIQSLSLSEVPERSRDRRGGVSESLPSLSPASSSPQASPYSAPAYSPQLPIPEGILVPTKVSHVPPREPYQPPAFLSTLAGLRGRAPRHLDFIQTSPRLNSPRRSHSGPPGPSSAGLNAKPFPLLTRAVMTPLPPSPSPPPPKSSQPYVYYESAPSPTIAYPVSPRYPPRFHHAAAIAAASVAARARVAPSPTATPTAHSHFQIHHAHSHSMTTVHARTPSPRTGVFTNRSRGDSNQSTGSASPSPPDSLSAGSDSPAPSSLSSQCDAGADLVRWEGEEDGAPDVDGGGKVGGWRGVQAKVPADVLSHPYAKEGEEAVPRPTRGTPPP